MPQALHVLIVEDNPDDAEALVRELRHAGFEPNWARVDTEAAFLRELQGNLDLVFSDCSMPQFSALRALELLKQSGLEVPFIVISGTIGEDTAVEIMKLGASDYLLKDRLGRLGSAVTRALEDSRVRRERQQTDEALRVAHVQLGRLLEHSPAVLYVLKLEGERVVPHLVSENMATLLGFAVSETLSYDWWFGQLHPEDRQAAVSSVTETLRLGSSRTEYRLRRKDGHYCWVDDARRLVRDSAGKPLELIGVWTDISERKRVQSVLNESNRRFREMLENVELIAMTLDKTGAITFCNDFLLHLTGWKREEVIGHSWFEKFLPDSAAEVKKLFTDTIDLGKTPAHLQNPIKTKSGEIREIVWNNTLLRDSEGHIVGTASIGEDITERSRAERALRESEAKFREVVENIQEVFWMTDAGRTKMLYISPGYEAIWGRSCKSLYAQPDSWFESIDPDDRERVLKATAARQARGDYNETYRIVRPDRAVRWIRERAFPIRDEAGNVHRLVGTAEDVTEYRTLEDQFRQAQKLEAIGLLADGIAHDFNNILAAISGYTELCQMILKGNPEVREHFRAVLKATSRATDLVRQILTFSRERQQERRPLQLRPIVNESLKLLRATVPSTIEFDISLATDAPTVLADPTQIHQILMNLGTNAWHAMKDQSGRLQVKLEKCEVDAAFAEMQPGLRPGSYARLTLTDTGCGMDRATLRRIFEPFFTTKPPGEGTGLGLAVVRGIMDSHEGAVTVYSQVGEGTVFNLYFPAHAGEPSAVVAKEGPVPRGHGETVLLVDDEDMLARLGQRTLAALGYTVEVATEPAAALAMVQNDPQRFALVVTDQTMPGMTGIRLASQIRQIRPDLPIILMTGYGKSLESEQTEAAGIRRVLLKPATLFSLGTAVQEAISAAPAGQALPGPHPRKK
jgi:PAS domain S-box-containing protein